jgi:hypothetical protein
LFLYYSFCVVQNWGFLREGYATYILGKPRLQCSVSILPTSEKKSTLQACFSA